MRPEWSDTEAATTQFGQSGIRKPFSGLVARQKGDLIALVVDQATRSPNHTSPVKHCESWPPTWRKTSDYATVVRSCDQEMKGRTCADVRSAAMAFLAGVDALIFDLRDSHGGADPAKGPDLLSYLFDQPVHLSDIYDRTTGRTTEYWIQPVGPEKQLGTIPVYVLTSQSTFSAAEYFAYNLQALKRATIVGEVTGGGSHLVSAERIDDRFGIRVPHARPINPLTKADWEGVGVIPDVKVSTSVALATAEELALAEIQKRLPRR